MIRCINQSISRRIPGGHQSKIYGNRPRGTICGVIGVIFHQKSSPASGSNSESYSAASLQDGVKTKKSYRKWNQAEIEALNWFHSSTTVSLVSDLLGRSRSIVKVKAANLNFGKRKTPIAWGVDSYKFKYICIKIKAYIDNGILVPTQVYLHILI